MYRNSTDSFLHLPAGVTLRSCELPLIARKAVELLGTRGRRVELELVDAPPPVLADLDLVAIVLAQLIEPDAGAGGGDEPALIRAYAVPGGVELCVLDVPCAADGLHLVPRELLAMHGSELEQVELGRPGLTYRFRLAAAR